MASVGKKRKILIVVENLPVPFDRRVWQESCTLKDAGYQVSIICPIGKGYEKKYECLNGINIYRHCLPTEASGALGYAVEYSAALFWEFILSWKVFFKHGFDVIHACNPPDTIFLIGMLFKILGIKFIFDHHDINPELYLAKFGKRDIFYKCMLFLERSTFRMASVSIATNESYRKIAIDRGKMDPNRVFVVRSGPNIERLKITPPVLELKKGCKYLVGYVGVMGKQEGLQFLLQAARYIVFEKGRRDIHFGLVGGGTELEEMRSYANKLQIEDFITFTGRVSDKEMLEMLNTADICVNPDVANEMNDKSTMNKIMEYMALGKPIVQFDLMEGRFSAKEASLYAKNNDPIDMAERILELLADENKRKQMGLYGRRRIENELEWRHEAPKLLAAYEKVFENTPHF